jgi:hypothetical protein
MKILGLGMMIIVTINFCDVQRNVSNDQAYGKLSDNEES